MSEKKEIIKDTLSYTVSNYISRSIALIKNLVIAKLFSPALFGVWKTLNLILGYNDYSNMGFYEGMFREIPFKLSKGKDKEANKIRNNALSIVTIITLLISILIFVLSFFFKQKYPNYVVTSIRLFALLVLFDQANTFLKFIFRIRKKFALASKVMIFMSIIDFILVVIFLLLKAQITGLLMALIITQIATLVYAFSKSGERKFKFELNRKILLGLAKVGFFIMMTFFLWVIFRSIDQLMVMVFLGPEQMGYYSLAQGFSSWIYTIPSIFGLVISTYMFSKFGKRKKIQDIEQHLIQSTKILAYLIPMIIGLSYVVIPVFINYFLPDYIESVFIIKVLLLSTFFVSLMHAPTYYLIAINKQAKLVRLGIVSLLVVALLDFIAIKQNLGIKGVAIATSLAYFVYITLLLSFALNEQKCAFKKKFLFFVGVYFPFVYSCLILVVLDLLIGDFSNVLFNDIFLITLKMIAFILLSLPLVIYINKKTKIIEHLFFIIRSKSSEIRAIFVK